MHSSMFSALLLASISTYLSLTFALPAPSPIANPAPLASPSNIPQPQNALAALETLITAPEGSREGYSRDKFKHWTTVNGTCNTRETVLKRDGTGVVQNSACAATSGTWKSPYDGATWHDAQDIQIDHMVPLAEAWSSGASNWTSLHREQFANDLIRPQLWAVTGDVNNEKSDSRPDEWKPPLKGFWCTYASAWVEVKKFYELSVTAEERGALEGMLEGCS